MTTPTARQRNIYLLMACLGGPHPDLTPAEVLRNAGTVKGWTLKTSVPGTRPGTYAVDAGDGKGERIMRREALVAFLTRHWLPLAQVEVEKPDEQKETTTP